MLSAGKLKSYHSNIDLWTRESDSVLEEHQVLKNWSLNFYCGGPRKSKKVSLISYIHPGGRSSAIVRSAALHNNGSLLIFITNFHINIVDGLDPIWLWSRTGAELFSSWALAGKIYLAVKVWHQVLFFNPRKIQQTFIKDKKNKLYLLHKLVYFIIFVHFYMAKKWHDSIINYLY